MRTQEPMRTGTLVPVSRRSVVHRWNLRIIGLATLMALSACGSGGYDEYRITDAWGNQETIRVPIGKSPGEVSSSRLFSRPC